MTTRIRAWVMTGATLIALGTCTFVGGLHEATLSAPAPQSAGLGSPIGVEFGATLRQALD
ncbi:hypothetical protein [Corynebacterium sp. A21]|uniref:hypothetical protein n=1 Tax=Corynebacterium sp. A21 TaxID=3457318 RepID=UPI003FD18E79